MKNKKVRILEFGTCWPFSAHFISETIKHRGNMWKFSIAGSSLHNQFKEGKKKKKTCQNLMKNNSLYLPNVGNFRKMDPYTS